VRVAVFPAGTLVAVEYRFFYLRWNQLEERGWTWADVASMDWDTLERSI
jgi:hypothetical protein